METEKEMRVNGEKEKSGRGKGKKEDLAINDDPTIVFGVVKRGFLHGEELGQSGHCFPSAWSIEPSPVSKTNGSRVIEKGRALAPQPLPDPS